MRCALAGGPAEVVEIRLDETYSRDAGPICGGVMRIFVCRPDTRMAAAYAAALDARQLGLRGALITSVAHTGADAMWVQDNGTAPDYAVDPEAYADCLRHERSRAVASATGIDYFIEPVVSAPRLLVVGGGHVGQEVVRQAVNLGFVVTVVDDRAEFAAAELFPPGVSAHHGNISKLVAQFPKGRDAFIVLVSKGHRPDAEALEACIREEVAFLGMIGSERKIRLLRRDFLAREIASPEEFDRVVAPIGVDVGAITVPEIGVSIAAQLVAARRKGTPLDGSLRLRPRSERTAGIRGLL